MEGEGTVTIMLHCERCNEIQEFDEVFKNVAQCTICKTVKSSTKMDPVHGIITEKQRKERTSRYHSIKRGTLGASS